MIWDDEYGISVPNEFQITKGDLSALLSGFQRAKGSRRGYDVHRVKGWDYPALCETYRDATQTARREHVPSLIHVTEMTQPQGHSTSGSHERYKSPERLQWESDHDCLTRMREWMIEQDLVAEKEFLVIEEEDRQHVRDSAGKAWEAYAGPIRKEREALIVLLENAAAGSSAAAELGRIRDGLRRIQNPLRRDLMRARHDALVATRRDPFAVRESLRAWGREQEKINQRRYSSHLHSESRESALSVKVVPPVYADDAESPRGFEILNRCFDMALERYPQLIALGEDVGQLGDVNQGFAGLQKKYGELRVSDTGIREATIVGQGIGMAMRGLRPIVEIQYLDYLIYAYSPLLIVVYRRSSVPTTPAAISAAISSSGRASTRRST